MSNWTKEQLKDLARVSGSRKNKIPTEETESAEESQRKVHKRAIPKTLFSAILLAPALVIVYLFMGNNLNFDQNHQELKAAEPEPQTKQLQVQLKAANDKIEELEAKMAVVKQEQSRSVPEVQKKTPSPSSKTTVSSRPVARPKPKRPKRVVTQSVARTRVAPPSPPKSPTTPLLPSVYGAGSIQDNQEAVAVLDSSTEHQNSEFEERGLILASDVSEQSLSPLSIAPELEAPLLQEQSMLILRTGTTARASLAVPWVGDMSGSRGEDSLKSVVLTEPLMAEEGKVFLPAQTTILVRAENLVEPEQIELVAEYAYLPSQEGDTSITKIPLPEGIIRFSSEDGEPLVAEPLEDESQSQVRGFFDLLDSADRAWQVGRQVGRSRRGDVVGDVLSGQRQIRYGLSQGARYQRAQGAKTRSQLLFLPEGTKLKLYVVQETVVPSTESSY